MVVAESSRACPNIGVHLSPTFPRNATKTQCLDQRLQIVKNPRFKITNNSHYRRKLCASDARPGLTRSNNSLNNEIDIGSILALEEQIGARERAIVGLKCLQIPSSDASVHPAQSM